MQDIESLAEPATDANANTPEPVLACEALSWETPSDRRLVLQDVAVKIFPGTLTLLSGDSGSGKSTLLSLLAGFRKTQRSGEIWFRGRPFGELAVSELATIWGHELGFVFQRDHFLRGRTALENLLAVPYCADQRSAALRLLESLGIAELADGEPTSFSGGERRRLSVARALVASPSVLLADEPTASLDSGSKQDVIESLVRYVERGGAALLATHSLGEWADRSASLSGRCRTLKLVAGQLSESIEVG